MPSQKLAALTRTPVWSIINRGDVNPESIQIAMRVINGAGGSMGMTKTDTPGHNAWTPAMENYNSIQWMLAQKRGGWFVPPPGTIIHNKPRSFLFMFALYALPLAIIIYLTRETVREWVSTTYQSVREGAS
jgi:hypothetical protein